MNRPSERYARRIRSDQGSGFRVQGSGRTPKVSVVVPTLNNVRFTAQMFASLARNADGIPYEIIVVDNGSDDETLSFVGSHTPGQRRGKAQGETPPVAVRLLHNPEKHALAHSWNMGADAACADLILITNNDVIFSPGALRAMVEAATGSQRGIVIPLSPQDAPGALPDISIPETVAQSVANIEAVEAWKRARPDTGDVWYVKEPYIRQGGYCFLITRACWERVGRFDEEYDLTGEDYDWFKRALRWVKMIQARDAYVEHFGKSSCMWLYDDYHIRLCRNRFRLAEKQDGQYEMFSVILPVYNRVESLKAAIQSVLAQTFPHWKLYVIDDGSEDWDRIQGLAQTYAHEAGRIWFFHKGKREGPGAARNMGLSLSRGKYVAFLDSDDLWLPHHLAQHWEAHERGGWEMVYSDPEFAWRWWDEKAQTFLHRIDTHPTISYWGEYSREYLQEFNYIQTSAVTVWGETARRLRFPTDKWVEEDWDYFKQVEPPCLHLPVKTSRYHLAKNPEQEHLITRVVRLEGAATGWETRQSVVIPQQLQAREEIGVVIPTRDRPPQLRRAIESIGYADIPFVVVDDGSRDAAAVRAIVEEFPRGALLRSPQSHGASWARNRGIEYLNCAWIRFLDDDDVLTADWLERLRPALTEEWDVITTAAWVPSCSGLEASEEVYTSQIAARREILLRVGGFKEHIAWAEERDLMARLAEYGARGKTLRSPTVVRPSRGGSGLASAASAASHPVPSTEFGPESDPDGSLFQVGTF